MGSKLHSASPQQHRLVHLASLADVALLGCLARLVHPASLADVVLLLRCNLLEENAGLYADLPGQLVRPYLIS